MGMGLVGMWLCVGGHRMASEQRMWLGDKAVRPQ